MDEKIVFEGLNDEEIRYITYNFIDGNYRKNFMYAIENLPSGFKNDKKKAMKLLHFRGSMIRYLNKNLHDDEEIVLMALNNYVHAVNYASERLKDDYVIGFKLSKIPNQFESLSKRLRRNKNICINAINTNPYNINSISYKVEFFKECFLISLKQLTKDLQIIRLTNKEYTSKNKKPIFLCDPCNRDKTILIYLPKDLYNEIKNFREIKEVIKYLEKSIELDKRKIINKFYDIYIY